MFNQRGYTIIELLVVVLIIALIIAMGIPAYNKAMQRAKETRHNQNVRRLEECATIYLLDAGPLREDISWPQDNDGWMCWIAEWPENPCRSGEYKVTIKESGEIIVSPGFRDFGW